MVVWFAVAAPVLVAEIFRSPMVDYRTVVIGALLPLSEVVVRGSFVFHTLAAPVLALALVMGVTTNRRLRRRRLLGLPIGLFLHQLLDGTWTNAELFWWPAFGWRFSGSLPESGRSLAVGAGFEVLGIIVAVWAWRRYELSNPANRRLLVRSGHLARGVLP